MAKSPAEELRIVSRRVKVARMLLRGVTNQYEITAALGMEPTQRTTISRDITVIKEEWKSSAVRDFDEAKGRELEKLEALEKEYWDAWERSCQEKQSSRTKRRTSSGEATDEAELKKEHRDGNPAFLDGVLKCVAKRCEIMGLDAPKKVRHGGDDEAPPIKTETTLKIDPATLKTDELRLLLDLRKRLIGNSPGLDPGRN